MEIRYVENEDGERVGVLLDIEEYERLAARHHAAASAPDDDEDFDPEESERRITEFITSADELPGPSVADLAEQATELMRTTWSGMEEIMDSKPHNKVLATQLLLSQRARGLQADDLEQWRLFAATTLLSGMISAPGGGR